MGKTIYKSNAIIEAGFRLSVGEQRIILACIAQVESSGPITDEMMYSVTANALADISGVKAKTAYEQLADAALKLKRRDVRIVREPNGKGRKPKVLVTCWVQTIAYIEDEGRVELRFSKDILPYISELKSHFTKYKLEHVARMDSSYGIRLYELLVQWQSVGEREIEIDWLREQFQIGNLYPRMFDFKKRVIDPAVDDINNHSNLWCEWGQRKTGRKVTHLQFKFGVKSEKKPKPKAKPKALPAGGEPTYSGIPRSEVERLAKGTESYEEAGARISRERERERGKK